MTHKEAKARDARRYYQKARALKRRAASLAGSVPHSIIGRGPR